MFKLLIAVAILGMCQCAEHAVSSQSIVLHHVEHKHEHKDEHKAEDKAEHKAEQKIEHKAEHKYVKVIPIVEVKHEAVKAAPVEKHVAESSHKHHEPAISSQHISRHDEPAHPPKDWVQSDSGKYEFEYQVKDPHTGDHKYQHEANDGHNVKGVYSLHEADGSVRTVHYKADKHAGFSADVQHSTKHVHEDKHH